MEQAHVYDFGPLNFYAVITCVDSVNQDFTTLLENDFPVNVVFWYGFLNVSDRVHNFYPQVEQLEYASVHLDQMVEELLVPLLECEQEGLLTSF